jgi:hypothetical protein
MAIVSCGLIVAMSPLRSSSKDIVKIYGVDESNELFRFFFVPFRFSQWRWLRRNRLRLRLGSCCVNVGGNPLRAFPD